MALPIFQEANDKKLENLFIYAYPKVGKTSLVSGLPGSSLHIDTENGTKGVGGAIFNTIKESRLTGISESKLLSNLAKDIIAANAKKNDYEYDWIVIDTATGLERIANTLANGLYRNSAMGKDYVGGDIVLELEYGGGYGWLRKSFVTLLEMFQGISRYGLIVTGHVKLSSLRRKGKEISTKDINLTGKLKDYITMNFDAVGLLTRDKENPNIVKIDFVTEANDMATGSRLPQFNSKTYTMSKLKGDTMEFNWNNLYEEVEKKTVKWQ